MKRLDAFGAVLLLTLSACGSGSSGSSAATSAVVSAVNPTLPAEKTSGEATLIATDNTFAPLTVAPGRTVVLRSGDVVPHTAIAGNGEWSFDEATSSFVAPDAPGSYAYFCGVHGKGMSGTLVVEK